MFARVGLLVMICAAPAALLMCSGFTASDECEPGEGSPCESQCGPGTMHCSSDGSWGPCQPERIPDCIPGEFGDCELTPGTPPGLWFCSDECSVGPCMPLCIPDETFECQAQCGPGQQRCLDDGSWGECREFVLPPCRPGEIERCGEGEGHRRCTDSCEWTDCEESACAPGEVAECGACASQVCQADDSWSECSAYPWSTCSPGDTESCEAPCGPGERLCTDRCEWTQCMEVEPVACHPGDRQICPTTLYCGVAFRVCRDTCDWTDCIETGD